MVVGKWLNYSERVQSTGRDDPRKAQSFGLTVVATDHGLEGPHTFVERLAVASLRLLSNDSRGRDVASSISWNTTFPKDLSSRTGAKCDLYWTGIALHRVQAGEVLWRP